MDSDQVVVFEDTESGLRAADGAGLRSIGIRHFYNRNHDFSAASRVYESYERDIGGMKKTINALLRMDAL